MSSNAPTVQPEAAESARGVITRSRITEGWRELKKMPPIGFFWGVARKKYFRVREIQKSISYLPHHFELRRRPWTKLQLGAGSNVLPGWLNTDFCPGRDVLKVDATRPLPFADGSFRYVFSEHMIEHLTRDKGRIVLREVNRVLVSGSKLRISTPNFDFYLRLFRSELTAEQREFISWHVRTYSPNLPSTPLSVMNTVFRNWGHKHLYDEASLTALLTECGFGQIKRFYAGESDDPELRGIESHGRLVGDAHNRMETLVLEATKVSSVFEVSRT